MWRAHISNRGSNDVSKKSSVKEGESKSTSQRCSCSAHKSRRGLQEESLPCNGSSSSEEFASNSSAGKASQGARALRIGGGSTQSAAAGAKVFATATGAEITGTTKD